MQTLEYKFVDKGKWGSGPWDDEPDKRQWQDPATGFPCLIVRAEGTGALCGYVGVPKGHRWHRKDYSDVDASVHGGVTYTAACDRDEVRGICHKVEPGEPDDMWWVGFDCAHYMDVSPAMDAALGTLPMLAPRKRESVYRDWAYVESEVRNLALQAKYTS